MSVAISAAAARLSFATRVVGSDVSFPRLSRATAGSNVLDCLDSYSHCCPGGPPKRRPAAQLHSELKWLSKPCTPLSTPSGSGKSLLIVQVHGPCRRPRPPGLGPIAYTHRLPAPDGAPVSRPVLDLHPVSRCGAAVFVRRVGLATTFTLTSAPTLPHLSRSHSTEGCVQFAAQHTRSPRLDLDSLPADMSAEAGNLTVHPWTCAS